MAKRIGEFLLIAAAILLASCGGQNTEGPLDLEATISAAAQATVEAQVDIAVSVAGTIEALRPTPIPAPTATLVPSPVPTSTPIPTATPFPSPTPRPTVTPIPFHHRDFENPVPYHIASNRTYGYRLLNAPSWSTDGLIASDTEIRSPNGTLVVWVLARKNENQISDPWDYLLNVGYTIGHRDIQDNLAGSSVDLFSSLQHVSLDENLRFVSMQYNYVREGTLWKGFLRVYVGPREWAYWVYVEMPMNLWSSDASGAIGRSLVYFED